MSASEGSTATVSPGIRRKIPSNTNHATPTRHTHADHDGLRLSVHRVGEDRAHELRRDRVHEYPAARTTGGGHPMRCVVRAAAPDRSSISEPGDHHDGQIEQRHAGEQHRRQHTRRRWSHRKVQLQDQRGDHEAQEHRPRIAEEDLRGWDVVAQEAERGAGGGERQRRDQVVAVVPGDRRDPQRRRDGHPGCDPIHVVDEVEGIGDRNHPQHRDGQVDPRGVEDSRSNPDEPQRDRRHHLVGETDPRRHRLDVVEQPNESEHEGAADDDEQLTVRSRGEPADDEEPGGHRHATEIRRRAYVGLVGARVIHDIEASGEPAGDRRQCKGCEQGDHERHGVADPSRDALPRERVARDEDGGPGTHGLRHRTPVLHRDRTAMMPALPWFPAPRRVACRHE